MQFDEIFFECNDNAADNVLANSNDQSNLNNSNEIKNNNYDQNDLCFYTNTTNCGSLIVSKGFWILLFHDIEERRIVFQC